MRIFNTKQFIDKNRVYIQAYYENIITDNLSDPNTVRALLECKLYHLPPYFELTGEDKLRISRLVRPNMEYHLLHQNSIISLPPALKPCPSCSKDKELVSIKNYAYCIDCWDKFLDTAYRVWKNQITWTIPEFKYFTLKDYLHESSAPPGFEWLWELEEWKDLVHDTYSQFRVDFKYFLSNQVQPHIPDYPEHSIKKTLMATLIGCNNCGQCHHPDTGNIWSHPAVGWLDGICPECSARPTLSTRPALDWHSSAYEPVAYTECVRCKTNSPDIPYALWGMCDNCYATWQQAYLDQGVIYELSKTYGTTAVLVLNQNKYWVRHIRKCLPSISSVTIHDRAYLVPLTKRVEKVNIKSLVRSHMYA